jgi:putative redox protein
MERRTMERNSRLEWIEGFHFDGYSHSGKRVRLDSWKDREIEEAGPTPAEMIPMALGACTGMDVILIAEKMRMELIGFELEVNAQITDEHPKVFTEFELIYHVKGEDLDPEKVERAVALSRDKYCLISNTLKKAAAITHHYTINGGEPVEVP